MTRYDDEGRRGRGLPVESGSQKLEELEPHQRKIERAASLYYAGCRTVAKAISAIKDRFGDRDDRR